MEIISWIILRCNFNKEVAVGVLLSHQSQHGGEWVSLRARYPCDHWIEQ